MILLHVQDLLDHRIIEHGSFAPTYTKGRIGEAICDIIEIFNLTLTEKQLEIIFTDFNNLEFLFDRRRLQQVVLNLLSNAAKFQKEGVIEITSNTFTDNNELFLSVSVEDHGVGLT